MLRILTILFLFVLIAVASTYIFFQFYHTTYPRRCTITRSDGKSLEVDILGREGDSIFFSPVNDKYRYEIALSELTPKDELLLRFLLTRESPVGDLIAGDQPNYVRSREEALEKLKEDLQEVRADITSVTITELKRREKMRQARILEAEIRQMEHAISSYE